MTTWLHSMCDKYRIKHLIYMIDLENRKKMMYPLTSNLSNSSITYLQHGYIQWKGVLFVRCVPLLCTCKYVFYVMHVYKLKIGVHSDREFNTWSNFSILLLSCYWVSLVSQLLVWTSKSYWYVVQFRHTNWNTFGTICVRSSGLDKHFFAVIILLCIILWNLDTIVNLETILLSVYSLGRILHSVVLAKLLHTMFCCILS